MTEPTTNEQLGERTAPFINKEATGQLHSPKMEEESQVLSWAGKTHTQNPKLVWKHTYTPTKCEGLIHRKSWVTEHSLPTHCVSKNNAESYA